MITFDEQVREETKMNKPRSLNNGKDRMLNELERYRTIIEYYSSNPERRLSPLNEKYLTEVDNTAKRLLIDSCMYVMSYILSESTNEVKENGK